jgi:hypothetical protein
LYHCIRAGEPVIRFDKYITICDLMHSPETVCRENPVDAYLETLYVPDPGVFPGSAVTVIDAVISIYAATFKRRLSKK